MTDAEPMPDERLEEIKLWAGASFFTIPDVEVGIMLAECVKEIERLRRRYEPIPR